MIKLMRTETFGLALTSFTAININEVMDAKNTK